MPSVRSVLRFRATSMLCAAFGVASCILPDVDSFAGGDASSAKDAGRGDAATRDGPANFCSATSSSGTLACEDFEAANVGPTWTTSAISATVVVTADAALTGSAYGLRLRHVPGEEGYASIISNVGSTPNGVRIAFRARIDGPTLSNQELVIVELGTTSCHLSPKAASCQNGSTVLASGTFAPPPLGATTSWSIDVWPGGLRVDRDGVLLFEATPALSFAAPTTILVGPDYLAPADDWNVCVDDILVSAR